MTTAEALDLIRKARTLPAYNRAPNVVRGYVQEILWAEHEPEPYGDCEAHRRESLAYIAAAKKIVAKVAQ